MKVRDPVHGFIKYDDKEEQIINTQIFQRLRGIKQLALASLVYPGAHHTRFEHSLGVMHLYFTPPQLELFQISETVV